MLPAREYKAAMEAAMQVYFFCKSIWSIYVNFYNSSCSNVLAFRQLRVQIWHHDLSFVGQFRIAGLVEAETAVHTADSLHWDQPRGHFRDVGAGEVGQLPVERFTVIGPRTDQMFDPSIPKITGPNEVLVKIAKNICSCAISKEQVINKSRMNIQSHRGGLAVQGKHLASGCRMMTPSSDLQHQNQIEVLQPVSIIANEHDVRILKSRALFLFVCFNLLPQHVDFFVHVDKIATSN